MAALHAKKRWWKLTSADGIHALDLALWTASLETGRSGVHARLARGSARDSARFLPTQSMVAWVAHLLAWKKSGFVPTLAILRLPAAGLRGKAGAAAPRLAAQAESASEFGT